MNENFLFLANFYVVLLISLIWLCVCEICYSVVCFICDCQILVFVAAYRPGAPCSLIFLAFSSNLGGAPYIKVRLIVRKLR
jgi:hypothetical protein